CKTFSAQADGVAWSEGAAVLVLKRMSDALADGDRILAVVEGSAVNQDGRSNGLTAPNGPSQQRVLRAALHSAGVLPEDIDYIEAHGTGTRLGDPIEVGAIGAVMASVEQPVRIGSIKTHIGHTQAAAGVAGIIKVALSLQHERIPANLHFSTPSPHIDWENLNVSVVDAHAPWPRSDRPRRAGVSSFGISGTNAHIILREPPVSSASPSPSPLLLPLSARSSGALRVLASSWLSSLSGLVSSDFDAGVSTALHRRSVLSHRVCVVGEDRAELMAGLERFARDEADPGWASGVVKRASGAVFVFPGQGSQWVGMGVELYDSSPVFAAALDEVSIAIESEAGFSVVDVLHGPVLSGIDVIQPVLFSVMVALAKWWMHHGIEPVAVIGHSQGEIAAAHIAGILSLQDAARIICRRSTLLTQIAGQGGMTAIGLSAEAVEALLVERPALSIAVLNSDAMTVVSGELVALSELEAQLTEAAVFFRRVKVNFASHSPQIDPLRAEFIAAIGAITPRIGHVPLVSTTTGDWLDGLRMDADYWADNLRQPVRFAAAVQRLTEDRILLEVSPHPVLTMPAESLGYAAVSGPTRSDAGLTAMHRSLGALFVRGVVPDWSALCPPGPALPMPTHPFLRQRFWVPVSAGRHQESGHPLLGTARSSALHPEERLQESTLSLAALPWLGDHRVRGEVWLPAAAILELVLSAMPGTALSEVAFIRPVILPDEGGVSVQWAASGAEWMLSVASDGVWQTAATGRTGAAAVPPAVPDLESLQALPSGSVRSFYSELAGVGLEYGPAFRGVETIHRGSGEALVAVTLPEAARPGPYRIHPALLDAALHALLALEPAHTAPAVPVSIAQVTRYSNDTPAWSYARQTGPGKADLILLSADGGVVMVLGGVTTRRLSRSGDDSLFLGSRWAPAPAVSPSGGGRWLLVGEAPIRTPLSEALSARGATVLSPPSLDVWPDAVDGVVLLSGLSDAISDSDPASVGVAGWLGLQSILSALPSDQRPPTLVLLTENSQPLRETIRPAQAVLWGAGGALALERSELGCRRIDVGGVGDAAALADELLGGSADQVALVDGQRHVLQLVRDAPPQGEPPALRPDRSYLITGGLGGLGLSVAGWLARGGAGHIILVGRRGITTPEQSQAVAALEEAGASVTVAAADVADPAAMQAVLTAAAAPLAGVIHAAGVLADGLLEGMSLEQRRKPMVPKVAGAWTLHNLTASLPLDFLVFYSSAVSTVAAAGQANYAGANSFLDALAHLRRQQGLPAVSIGWGPFSEVGLAAAATSRGDRLASRGLTSFTPEQGLSLLERMLGSGATHRTVMDFDVRTWLEFYPQAAGWSSLSQLPRDLRPSAETASAGLDPARPETISAFVRDQLARILRVEVPIGLLSTPLSELGVDSLSGVELKTRLERGIGHSLSAALVWTYPTPEAIIGHLIEVMTEQELAETAPSVPVVVPAVRSGRSDAVAIVGVGCRFPGGGVSPSAFWSALESGVDAVTRIPASRWSEQDGPPGTGFGAFIEDIDGFDAAFFGISPREASRMDPHQRLLLEVVWEALENAGVPADSLKGSATGTFIGVSNADHQHRVSRLAPEELDLYTATGSLHAFAAGRLAYVLGLNGPTMAIDTACSSSLVAVHQAAQSLRSGECDLALAGGVNLILSPITMAFVGTTQALSPDGRCKTFDASANGFVRGEGCGVVVLKRLSDALSAGDRIWGVIAGSAVNQDGRSAGLTAPSRLAQERLLKTALKQANLVPEDIGYIEAHGTGTSLGDPIEVEAISHVFAQNRQSDFFLGAVKSNIGHLEAAAGIAGLIKVLLAFKHHEIPKNLHFSTLNPRMDLHSAFRIPTETVQWIPQHAGVSSFGLSGTNAHVVLSPPPEPPVSLVSPSPSPLLLPLSARSSGALRVLASSWLSSLSGLVSSDFDAGV
ncbi:MAG: acyl transferase domain-containing protein, partial [Myxococcota bacterium]